jgi:VWFA-related protein
MFAAVGALLAVAVVIVGQEPTSAQRLLPSFRAGVDLVSLQVAVTDPGGRYMTDLAPTEFSVFEDGVKQDISFFSRTPIPISVALLLDTSASMHADLKTLQEIAAGFARRMGPLDRIAVMGFDGRLRVLQDFTSDPTVLEDAIRRTAVRGTTALFDAVYIASQELKRSKSDTDGVLPRRRAIIALSDGKDTSSLISFDDAIDLAVRSETIVYSIGLGDAGPAFRFEQRQRQAVMRRMSQQTGGRAFFPTQVKELPPVYNSIRDELTHQYAISYQSKNPRKDAQWRKLFVRVERPDAVVRTRPGYFAGKG